MALPSSAREHGRSKCSGDSNPTWITLLMSLGCIRNWVNWRSTWDHWRCGTRIRITRFHCTMEGLDTESSLSPTIWSHSVLRWREWLENLFNIYCPVQLQPLLQDTKEILLYIVPCGGTVMMRILRQKRLLMEVRHIHKPSLQQINMTQLNSHEGRVVIKVLPNNVDESLRNIKVELTATSTDKTHRPPVYPRNLTVTYIPTLNSCNSVELLWHPVPDSKLVRYCMLLMISSPIEDVGICGVDEMIFKHPRFQQLHCFYSKFG